MNSSSPENSSNPTAAQMASTRAERWHQAGNALHSIEAMREWLNRCGLVLYSPRPQLGAPTPSLVEATLGAAKAAPELNEFDAARNLLARLIAEGNAVPLNLMGVTGGMGSDTPDFIASAAVFSYIFTLRGNKAWKQTPATSGAVKVSPLALATYEILVAKVTMSAYDLATQLGKEVTEAAVLRSLTELWGQLRVIPVPQQDGSATLWELASSRFTKQIKAGANAGQPTALSALISLYLGQCLAASEDEIESFLSPLAPRSRVRDVLHALLSARQLETLVIDGKTLLHLGGDVPAFLKTTEPETPGVEAGREDTAGDAAGTEAGESGPEGPRISKFTPRPGSKIGTGLRSKPASARPSRAKPFGARPFGARPGGAGRPGFGARPTSPGPGQDRERRPFVRDERSSAQRGFAKPRFEKPGSAKRTFDKPWEERPARLAAEGEDSSAIESVAAAGAASGAAAGSVGGAEQRPGFGNRFGGDRAGSAGARPPRREFTPGAEGEAPRRSFSKPGTFGRKREGSAERPAFGGGESRPPRREFGSREQRPASGGFRKPSFGASSGEPRAGGFAAKSGRFAGQAGTFTRKPGGFSDAPRPDFERARPAGRPETRPAGGEGEAPRKVFRKFDAPRERKPFGDKPAGAKPFGAKPFGAKPFGAKPFGAKSFGSKPAGDRPFSPRPAGTKPFGSRPGFAASGASGPSRTEGAERSSGAGPGRPMEGRARPEARPGGGFGGKKPYSKPYAKPGGPGGSGTFSQGGGPFAKFADGKKPFRKPGQPKPKRDSSGFTPVKRRPPEGNS